MYEELIKELRYCADEETTCSECKRVGTVSCEVSLHTEAADAIDELEFACNRYEINYKILCAYLPKWIPVTERLPEENVAVLVTYIGYDSHKPRVDMPAYRYEGTWLWVEDVTSDGPYGDVECTVPITHWMPLPEPPKEETE